MYDCPKDSLRVLLGLIKTFVCEMFPSCVQSLLEQNMLLNEAAISAGGGSVQCCELTWGVTSVTSLAQGWATPDLVVAADVVYHRELFDPLLSSLSSLGKTACLLCTQLYALYTCLRMRSRKGKCAVQPSLCCECIIIRMHLGAVKEGNHAVQPCLYVNE